MAKEHIQDVLDWPVPANWEELERFLGFINYQRNYLQALTGKHGGLLCFASSHDGGSSAGVSQCPDWFIVDMDASDFAISADLSQLQDGKEHTISYASMSLCSKQQGYCITRKELLAVVVFVRHYRHYLLGRKFVVRTDHASLVWLMRFKNPGGQICRWLQEISIFDFSIQRFQGENIPMLMICPRYEKDNLVTAMWLARKWVLYLAVDVSTVSRSIDCGIISRKMWMMWCLYL